MLYTPFIVHFATTFATLGFTKENIFIIFYNVHCVMVMSKRNKISFQHYVHEAVIMKKIGYSWFHKKYINCYNVNYTVIMTKKYIFSFQHY